MGQDTEISWCHHTANLWWGCTEVHEGCDFCYARTLAKSKGKGAAWQGSRFAVKSIWGNLAKWNDAAAKVGEIHRVFCGSMMDIFEKPLPASDWNGNPLGVTTGDLRGRLFNEVVPATPNLLYLLLTKRPGNATKCVPPSWLEAWPSNVMTGTSVVNQATADALIPQLVRVPGKRFLSMEPLLGPTDIYGYLFDQYPHREHWPHERRGQLHWVITGAESGAKARPAHPDWFRLIRDRCVAAGVPYHHKQWGEWLPDCQKGEGWTSAIQGKAIARLDHAGRDLAGEWGLHDESDVIIRRVGKKYAGRLLDGREWSQFPEAANA